MINEIRDVRETDYQFIETINQAEVNHTSPMNVARVRELDGYSSYHKVIEREGEVVGFLLAMRDGSEYHNDNYAWFSSRYKTFLYIDRVVVDRRFAGQGLGSLLYKDLFLFANTYHVPVIACEINSIPPNKASALFHGRFGFEEVGTQWLGSIVASGDKKQGEKQVSMQVAQVPESI